MKIKSIAARNLKGRSFKHDLAPVTIITGDNFSGKTAELSAIRLALMGYEPRLGKTAQAIFSLCGCKGGGATEMDVTATFDDGTAMNRAWVMKKGKISYSGLDTEAIPPVMLDPTIYFGLSGPQRLNYVLAQCDLEALGLGFQPLIEKLKSTGLEDCIGSAQHKAGFEVVQIIEQLETERIAENASVYDWMVAVVEAITELGRKAKATADTHEQTVNGLVDNKSADGMAALTNPQPDIDDARERLTAAVQTEANALTAFSEADRKVQEAKALAAKRIDVSLVEAAINKANTDKQLLGLVPDAGTMPAPAASPTAKPTDTTERQAFNNAQAEAQRTASGLVATKHASDRLVNDIERAKAATNCPTCGHDITDKQRVVIDTLVEELEKADAAQMVAAGEHDAARAAEKTAGEALESKVQAMAQWQAEDAAITAGNQAMVDKWNEKRASYNSAQSKINTLTAELAALQASIAGNVAANEAWVNLPVLEAANKAAGEAYKSAAAALAPIKESIAQLESKQRQFIARTQDSRRADQSRAVLKEASDRLAVFKAALKVVQAEKERVSQAAFDALLSKARLFTDGILKAPLAYVDGELGMCHEGNWISYKVFSGFEQLVSFMGLGVALTQGHKGIRIVMADECGAADKSNKMRLAVRLLELIEQGVINQAFLADTSADGYPVAENVAVIQVDNQPATA